ncbi:MAG: RNA degradosome polyphosphate kinase, partial [Nisaea sp.]
MSESQAENSTRIDAVSPERFFNRELSWLGFNARVLEEANNSAHPLLERLRFVSISASNLDEFYTVRVAGLKGMVNAGVTTSSADGLSPTSQLVAISEKAAELIAVQQRYLSMLLGELRTAGFHLITADNLTAAD